jgi:hypothetical protein
MAEEKDDPTMGENHFGRHNTSKSGTWASAIVLPLLQ